MGELCDDAWWGHELRGIRRRSGMTLVQLEEATGIDQSNISRIEMGRTPNVSMRTIERLLDAMGYELIFVSKRESNHD